MKTKSTPSNAAPRGPRNRKVKIVCTLGPASSSIERLGELVRAGLDVARLNFSHGTHEFHAGLIKNVREVARSQGRHIAILQDLQGPKIRLGKLPEGGITLTDGDRVLLYPEGATPSRSSAGLKPLPVSAEIALQIAQDVRVGARILFDDGKVSSVVRRVSVPEIEIEIEVGGLLTSHKGMNLPGTPLSIPCLTDKDIVDLKFGLEHQVDLVALSFVRSAADIEKARKLARTFTTGGLPLLVAKVERSEAVEAQSSIIEVSDGILIARGDMAIEVGVERVPLIQKHLIRECNQLGVPVITATQMLESMIQTPTPTRAEATDVANAVLDGTDAVMLSAETASGKYPIEAVSVMSRIITETEEQGGENFRRETQVPPPASIVDSIESAAARVAAEVGAVAIACITHSGMAARVLARYRPEVPLVAIMDEEAMLRKLAVVWGVEGIVIPEIVSTDDLFIMVERVLKENGRVHDGDLIVVTGGLPTVRRGTTNTIKVHRVGASIERSKRPT